MGLDKIRCSSSTGTTQTQHKAWAYTPPHMCVLILETWAGERTCHPRRGFMQCVSAADTDSSRDVLQAEKAITALGSRGLPVISGSPLPWGGLLLHTHSLALLPAMVISPQTQRTGNSWCAGEPELCRSTWTPWGCHDHSSQSASKISKAPQLSHKLLSPDWHRSNPRWDIVRLCDYVIEEREGKERSKKPQKMIIVKVIAGNKNTWFYFFTQ